MSIKKIKETSLISENTLSQKMTHSVTFPTNKGKQRKKYQALSSNHNLELKFNREMFLDIFIKNFLRLSSFFIFFAIHYSNCVCSSNCDVSSPLLQTSSVCQNNSNSMDEIVVAVDVRQAENLNGSGEMHDNSNYEYKDDNDNFQQVYWHNEKCSRKVFRCVECGIERPTGFVYESTSIRWAKYLLSSIVGGIVVAIIMNWYNSSNNSVDSEIKSREKRGSVNRKRGKERRKGNRNRRR